MWIKLCQLLKLTLDQISDQLGKMAELKEKEKQPCVEATETQGDSSITSNPKEEKDIDTKVNGKINNLIASWYSGLYLMIQLEDSCDSYLCI